LSSELKQTNWIGGETGRAGASARVAGPLGGAVSAAGVRWREQKTNKRPRASHKAVRRTAPRAAGLDDPVLMKPRYFSKFFTA
jgi:hypothetical protein